MKYEYFGNVLAQVRFTVEAKDEETADEKASQIFGEMRMAQFEPTGHEIGRYTDGRNYEMVERGGDLS